MTDQESQQAQMPPRVTEVTTETGETIKVPEDLNYTIRAVADEAGELSLLDVSSKLRHKGTTYSMERVVKDWGGWWKKPQDAEDPEETTDE